MPRLTLQPDATAGLDTFIRDWGAEDSNFGTSSEFHVGNEADLQNNRGLIKFDLSALPNDAIIASATLSLYLLGEVSANARTLRVYRQKRAWVEAEATWNIYSTGNSWQTPGGVGVDDCEQTDIGSRAFAADEALNEFKDFSLTPTTKANLDLTNGWLVRADGESQDLYRFASSDNVTPANRPKLVIVYNTPPPMTADAVIKKAPADSLTADAYLARAIFADAVIFGAQQSSIIADAILKKTSADSLTADSVLQKAASGTLDADGVLRKPVSDSIAADGVLFKTISDAIPGDAYLTYGVFADGVIFKTQTASFSADAIIFPAQHIFMKAGPIYIPVYPLT